MSWSQEEEGRGEEAVPSRRRVEEGRAVRRRSGRGEEGEDKRYLL